MNKNDLYYFSNLNIDELVTDYVLYLRKKGIKANTNKISITHKFHYLIHTIIGRSYLNEYGAASLNANILQKTIGEDYRYLLDFLEEKGIIMISKHYEIGISSRSFNILPPYTKKVKVETNTNKIRVLQYIEKANSLLYAKQESAEETGENEEFENDSFIYNYNKALKKLKVTDKEEFKNYIDNKNYLSENQKNYYISIFDKYTDNQPFNITSIDINKRIYSILTSTPRYLKNFLNIKYSIDISNSHPLLFNYFIINKFNIQYNTLNSFYLFINSNYYNITNISNNIIQHYTEYILNVLNIRNIDNLKITEIPDDIWLYIANTSKGCFWDDFKDSFMEFGLNRIDVKQTLFQEVFYSKKTVWKGTLFAKAFKEKYPNVFELIKGLKAEIEESRYENVTAKKGTIERLLQKNEADKRKLHLANDMMALESKIFHEILESLYKRRLFHVASIHDAIILLDTKNSNKHTIEEVKKVMLAAYKKYHLLPTLSIDDDFDAHKWHDEQKEQEANNILIKSKLEELNLKVQEGNKQAIDILDLIERGNAELTYNKESGFCCHRLFDNQQDNLTKKKYRILKEANRKLFTH